MPKWPMVPGGEGIGPSQMAAPVKIEVALRVWKGRRRQRRLRPQDRQIR
ncbi:MAG TPA: hypothetical protein PLH19_10665 [Anaerolineae bacterium]|nr:hypothetical protein [Anaerolineae bacterium]HQH38979.1 hypothetical protein [Anaerolineae bacterium]